MTQFLDIPLPLLISDLRPFLVYYPSYVLHQLVPKWPPPVLDCIHDLSKDELLLLTDEELSQIKIPHHEEVCAYGECTSEDMKYQCEFERFRQAGRGSLYYESTELSRKRFVWTYYILKTKNRNHWRWGLSLEAQGSTFFLARPYVCILAFVAAGDIPMIRRVMQPDVEMTRISFQTLLGGFGFEKVEWHVLLQYCVHFDKIDIFRSCLDLIASDERRKACVSFIFPAKEGSSKSTGTIVQPAWLEPPPANAGEWCKILRKEMLREDVEDVIRYSIVGVLEYFSNETDWVKELYANQPKKFEDAHKFAKKRNRANGEFLDTWLKKDHIGSL